MYLLIVTGLSGAGKSLALRCLEEQGFFTVDNLPSPMLAEFSALCETATKLKRVAVTMDSRESLLSRSAQSFTAAIDAIHRPYEVLFLDARNDVLQRRYNEARRRHPLGDEGDALSGIRREREYLRGIRDRANYVIDTSDIRSRDLGEVLSRLLPDNEIRDMSIQICSFGYKRGVPVDADVVFDMRFMENPFYDPDLRPLSGLDPQVRDFVCSQPHFLAVMDKWEEMLVTLLPFYAQQKKRVFRICFGCTGGRHRSVVAAEELAARLLAKEYPVRIYHRDLETESADIAERFSGERKS